MAVGDSKKEPIDTIVIRKKYGVVSHHVLVTCSGDLDWCGSNMCSVLCARFACEANSSKSN